MNLIFDSITDIGNTRPTNQDSIFTNSILVNDINFFIAVVCDGLGGLQCGEIASQKTISYIKEWFNCLRYRTFNLDNISSQFEYLTDELDNLILQVNSDLIDYSTEKNISMGTTLSLLFIGNDNYYIVNVGDSRIYKYNKNISQVTTDDSDIFLVDGQQKLVLTQCIGKKIDIDLRIDGGIISTGDAFLLCSDGFYKRMDLNLIIQYLENISSKEDIQYMEQLLIDDIKQKGEPDNISIIVVKSI